MGVIRIENFAGLAPSVSPRALGPNAAQKNNALLLSTPEFRPLREDTTESTITAGGKTLYRIDSTEPWIYGSADRSYVRGQINGDTTKRTFYSVNDSDDYLYAIDTGDTYSTTPRRLGVPAPAAPAVTHNDRGSLQLVDLAYQVQLAINNNPLPDTGRHDGTAPFAGPSSFHGLLTRDDANVVASGVAGSIADLYAAVPESRVTDLGLNTAALGAALYAGNWYIGITCLPGTYRYNTDLNTALGAITNPRTMATALSAPQVTTLVADITAAFNADNYAATQQLRLDELVQGFVDLLYYYSAPTLTVPDAGTATDPTGPKPVKPDVIVTTVTVDDTTNPGTTYTTTTDSPEYTQYLEDLAVYEANLRAYNATVSTVTAVKDDITAKLANIREESHNITVEVEQLGQRRFEELAWKVDWSQERLYALGGPSALPAVDAPRVTETRFYVATFVTDLGEESAPSTTSDMVELDQYDTVTIARPTVPSGRNISHWRIYRSNAGTQAAAFQLVTTTDNGGSGLLVATTSYTDEIESTALGEVCPTDTWAEPESGLKGLVGMPGGVMAAFKGNTVYFCHPYVPYAWPVEYQITTERPIVGLGVFGQTLFVGTEGEPYFISGSDSASMSSQRSDSNQACVSRRSIAMVQGGVLYASPDGLCGVSAGSVDVLTKGLYTREDWQALSPTTMFAIEHEAIYYLFYNNGTPGCLTFDMANKKLGTISDLNNVSAAFVDRSVDTLYLAAGTSLKKVYGASTWRTATWKTGKLALQRQEPFAWLRVFGNQSAILPVTVKWYGDGTLIHTATITDTTPVRLPAGRYLEHEVEISSKAGITHVSLSGSTMELQAS